MPFLLEIRYLMDWMCSVFSWCRSCWRFVTWWTGCVQLSVDAVPAGDPLPDGLDVFSFQLMPFLLEIRYLMDWMCSAFSWCRSCWRSVTWWTGCVQLSVDAVPTGDPLPDGLDVFSFQLMPFLLEIRYLMDWMWTDTALGLYSWVQMEDIYQNIFICACFLAGEDVGHIVTLLYMLGALQRNFFYKKSEITMEVSRSHSGKKLENSHKIVLYLFFWVRPIPCICCL